jgi:DNA-directed RNA polymerase specialized sigma24 family protein
MSIKDANLTLSYDDWNTLRAFQRDVLDACRGAWVRVETIPGHVVYSVAEGQEPALSTTAEGRIRDLIEKLPPSLRDKVTLKPATPA